MDESKDKHFGKVVLFYPHTNPEAIVVSGIKCYKHYSLKRAYLGETFFWGLLPQAGDQLSFQFRKPLTLRRYFFRSGNGEHPSDKFYNTTIEALLVNGSQYSNSLNITADGFVVIGKFDNSGIAAANVDENLGRVVTLRLHVHSDSDNWAILSEIHIQGDFTR
ncbi:hypothetical protein QE152_g19042 [Popillia japonica]|uniref:MGAT4 A/B/C C-terminal domain-containing protein n=1 Tax=Popillia japonica TaxID=7064 RepID=A0AAW1L3P0_POPJA